MLADGITMEQLLEADILGICIRRRTQREALDGLRKALAGPGPQSVYFVHAATANLAFESNEYRAILNRGDLVLNDGVGVRWAARAAGTPFSDNLVGTDLLPQFFQEQSRENPLRIFLLGGRPGIARRAAARLEREYPALSVAGFHHGYFSPGEEQDIVNRIRRLKPDLLLVGMGNPRQEEFIDRRLHELGCKAAIGVGGLFDHLAGELRRAPVWVRRLGLEWLQLLAQQPHKRQRYLRGIPRFLWRVFRPKLLGQSRRLAKALLGAGTGVAIGLLAGEGLVRLARPQILARYPEGLYVPSASRQYKLCPHFSGTFRYPEFRTHVRINGQGLREDREYPQPHPQICRILAVGDSFTMGYSVDQQRTWVRTVERLLNSESSLLAQESRNRGRAHFPPRRRYELINAGVPGYSTWQELAYLEEEGLSLKPDVVLLGFFIGNDIADNASPTLPVELRDGVLISAGARNGCLPFGLRLALARHSHLYQAAHSIGARDPRRYAIYTGGAGDGWRQTEQLFLRLSEVAKRHTLRAIVLLIPERMQVESALARAAAAEIGRPIDPAAPSRRMREISRRARLETIDLLDRMAGITGLYFAQDGHWNAQGNLAAASAIFEYLRHDPS